MTEYDTYEIASRFTRWKNGSIFSQYLETPALFKILGDLNGKFIVDYGCGTGIFTKKFAKTAYKVIGVDYSNEMIELAKKENNLPNIEYYVKDCTKNLNLDIYDMAVSVYLLNHSKNKEFLKQFLTSMYNSLKAGGICCGLTHNVVKPEKFHLYRKYNVSVKAADESFLSSNEIDIEFLDHITGEPLIKVTNYYIDPKIIEDTFVEVGFINFKWIPVTLDDKFYEYNEYLNDFINNPGGILYHAEKPL